MTQPPGPRTRLYITLLTWAHQHPNHPGLTLLAIHAHTRLNNPELADSLQALTRAGLIHRIHDPYVPGPDRWAIR